MFIILVLMVAGALWFSYSIILPNQITLGDVDILEAQLKQCQDDAELYNEFKSAMRNITVDPYNRDFNNCYDHSKRVQKAFAEMGIESSIFISEDRDHAWIAPWMEATTGQFIAPGSYDLLEVRDINLEVICD